MITILCKFKDCDAPYLLDTYIGVRLDVQRQNQ